MSTRPGKERLTHTARHRWRWSVRQPFGEWKESYRWQAFLISLRPYFIHVIINKNIDFSADIFGMRASNRTTLSQAKAYIAVSSLFFSLHFSLSFGIVLQHNFVQSISFSPPNMRLSVRITYNQIKRTIVMYEKCAYCANGE